jgi:hypothetical protein
MLEIEVLHQLITSNHVLRISYFKKVKAYAYLSLSKNINSFVIGRGNTNVSNRHHIFASIFRIQTNCVPTQQSAPTLTTVALSVHVALCSKHILKGKSQAKL